MASHQQVQRVEEGITQPQTPKPVRLTEPNFILPKLIHDYRLLRIRDLELLTGRKYSKLHGKLKALTDNGFLNRLKRPLEKDVYYLMSKGLLALL